jgi:hypothetical protein
VVLVSEEEEVEIKKRCPICKQIVDDKGTYFHFRNNHPDLNWEEWKNQFEVVEVKKEEGEGVPKPPEVEIIEAALEFIKERLPQIYGIEKYTGLIVRTLKDNPAPLRDPVTLHAFIKNLAPKVYDAHLSTFVINPLFAQYPNLPQAVDKYFGGFASQTPYLYQPSVYQPPYPFWQHYPPHQFNPQPPQHFSYYPPYYTAPYPYHQPPYQYSYQPPKPPKTYKIVVEGQEIETDEAGFMAWQRYKREMEEYELRKKQYELEMKKLEEEIKKIAEERGTKETLVPVKIGDKEYQVPASLAPLYLRGSDEASKKIEELSKKLEEEREARHKAEIEVIKKELEEIKKSPSFLEQLKAYQMVAETLGYHKTGKTTADLIDSLSERVDKTAQLLIQRITLPHGEWKPEVVRTPEERVKKAEEIKQKLAKSEEILKAEEELIRAAAKVKPRSE